MIYTNISVSCEVTFYLNFHFHLIINHSNKSTFESTLGSSFTEQDFNLLGGSRKMLLIIQLGNNKIIIYY